nr:MAG TPA: hypothetical protein [Caudoviricetes sp.]
MHDSKIGSLFDYFISFGKYSRNWQKSMAVLNFGKFYWQDLARRSLTTNKAICKLRI